MNTLLKETTLPVGALTAFAGNIKEDQSSPPKGGHTSHPIESWGWMVCDGRSLTVSEYPELFSALGYLYGGSDTKFNIPDLQGMFLRGIGTDDASTEKREQAKGGETNGIGSTQEFAVQKHVHIYTSPSEPTAITTGKKPDVAVKAINKKDQTSTPVESNTSNPGDVKVSQYETRPVNIFVYYLIKYTYKLPAFEL